MQEQECTLDLNTIEAAVAGEKWALEKGLAYCASIGMLIGIVIGTVIDYEKTSKEIDKIDDSLKGKS